MFVEIFEKAFVKFRFVELWLRFDTVGAHDCDSLRASLRSVARMHTAAAASVRPCRHFVWADRVVRPYNLKNKTHR